MKTTVQKRANVVAVRIGTKEGGPATDPCAFHYVRVRMSNGRTYEYTDCAMGPTYPGDKCDTGVLRAYDSSNQYRRRKLNYPMGSLMAAKYPSDKLFEILTGMTLDQAYAIAHRYDKHNRLKTIKRIGLKRFLEIEEIDNRMLSYMH